MRKMGGLSSIMSMMPGLGGLGGKNKLPDLDSPENDKKMARMEAIIYSMTPEERKNPDLLNPSRKTSYRKRCGSGYFRSEPHGKTVQRVAEDDEKTSGYDGR